MMQSFPYGKDIRDPNIQEWLAQRGIPVDYDGIPLGPTLIGPPQTCELCSDLAELPADICITNRDDIHLHLVGCRACITLAYTNWQEYLQRVDAAFRRKLKEQNDSESETQ